MVDESGTLILIWPGGLEDGTVLRLDKTYVETKGQWQEFTDRALTWRIK